MSEAARRHTQNTGSDSRAAGTSLLTVTGLAAIVGASSCCALPLALSALGLSGAWLGGLGHLAAPWQSWLLWAGLACIVVAATPLLRRPTSCAPDSLCRRPAFRRLILATCAVSLPLAGFVLWIG